MMASDRVIAEDEGKAAFMEMEAAVNNADERVSGINDDLAKTLKVAESAPAKY